MPPSPFATGSGSNFSSPVDVAQANAALHGHGMMLIDNMADAPFGSAIQTIVTSPAPMHPQSTLGEQSTPLEYLLATSPYINQIMHTCILQVMEGHSLLIWHI